MEGEISKHILIVEDEPGVSDFLTRALVEQGYSTALAERGDSGLEMLTAGAFDLALLDVMLPGMDGFALLERARAQGCKTPVLMLTAKGDVTDRVKGLDIGADDYLPKPFRLSELLARVKAVLRRAAGTSGVLELADLSVDLASRKVTRHGKPVYLSPTEFSLLELLLRTPGRPVPKAEILRQIWNDEQPRDTNVVEVYVNYLRNKIDRHSPRLIHTVRGQGYMIRVGNGDEA